MMMQDIVNYKKKYNIALTPTTLNYQVIKLSESLATYADQYKLGDNSLPHLTLRQFYAAESDIACIWEKTLNILNATSIKLRFEKFSCISFDNTVFWASLLPDHCDELLKMHTLVSRILDQQAKGDYDPHMTLINTRDRAYTTTVNKLLETYVPIEDIFIPVLGLSDDVGQLTQVIFKY